VSKQSPLIVPDSINRGRLPALFPEKSPKRPAAFALEAAYRKRKNQGTRVAGVIKYVRSARTIGMLTIVVISHSSALSRTNEPLGPHLGRKLAQVSRSSPRSSAREFRGSRRTWHEPDEKNRDETERERDEYTGIREFADRDP